jgi:hypothetical protein
MKSCLSEIIVEVVCIAPVWSSAFAILRLYYVRYLIVVYNLLFEDFVGWIPGFKVSLDEGLLL